MLSIWTSLKYCLLKSVNSLPIGKILDVTKLKAFADNKINGTKEKKFVLERDQNIVGKGYQHFSPFPQCFPKPSSLGSLKVGMVKNEDCVVKHE